MYEKMHGQKFDLCGVIVIETDDLLGAGIGQKFKDAIERLRERFKFGSWHWLKEKPRQYGGRTLHQLPDFSFKIDMNRYLRERAHDQNPEGSQGYGPGNASRDHRRPRTHGITQLGNTGRHAARVWGLLDACVDFS